MLNQIRFLVLTINFQAMSYFFFKLKRFLRTTLKNRYLTSNFYFIFSGIRNGACVLVEKALSRKLLYLPCRHHIFEIVLRSAFEVYWPASSGPNVPIYQRFKKKWDEIDQSNFTAGISDTKVLEVITPIKDEILKFVNNQIEVKFFNPALKNY